MAVPSRPQRKAAPVSPSRQATPQPGNIAKPVRKAAQPYGSVSREDCLPRKSAGVSPQSQPVNDQDAGSDSARYR